MVMKNTMGSNPKKKSPTKQIQDDGSYDETVQTEWERLEGNLDEIFADCC